MRRKLTESHRPRRLNEEDRRSIREELACGTPREKIAADLRISLKQVDAIRAHLTMASRVLPKNEMLERAYRYARARARSRGLDLLTFDECQGKWEEQYGRCWLTGIRFSNRNVNTSAKILSYPWRPSLDRIDPRGGYDAGNVRLVAQIVNFGLGEWPLREFKKMCKAVTTKAARVRAR